GDYGKTSLFANNIFFCALAGLLWYSQFFGLGMGKSFLEPGSVMMAFSWSILMALNVIFSNIWGIILKEWKGVSKMTIVVLLIGLAILIFSLIYPNL
ncbi:MAG: rhamnose/proton symporter RhaT, partial [Tannerella sp.]|nr:rhamnose/proton symporter RhaT [Tannerella sp.]